MLYLPSGQIGFLDFGLICRMEKKHKFAMLGAIIHIVNADWASLVGSLADMDIVRPGTNVSPITMDHFDGDEMNVHLPQDEGHDYAMVLVFQGGAGWNL
ncbi:hypothetical protein Lser_V15G23580 [Lactuca serriola]